jgi:branched-chain amino acid transport system substrate-binding protein
MKIGMLYPRSNAHPGMMPDFMDGLKTALKHQGIHENIQLFWESAGFGGNEKEVYEKVEKMLVLEDADILVAYVDLRVLEILKPLLYVTGKPVLIINPGANYPQNWVPQPNVLNLTLQHGFLCWLTGKLGAEAKTKNAAMVTSFYDCGYLHTAAIVKGFVEPEGSITFNDVNNQRYDDSFEIKQLADFLTSHNDTDALLCVFDSLPASLFYSRLNTLSDAGRLHLFVSPMMLEQKALEQSDKGFKFSINGYLPWHTSLENYANKAFVDSYLQKTKRSATVFSLLGWETALIIQAVFQNCKNNYTDGPAVAEVLKKIKINSPRGEMLLDDETNYFVTPVIKCSLQPDTTAPAMQIIGYSPEEWEAFVKDPVEGAASGWTNTYLCY